MREYNYAVFIGRFQPFHNEHYEVLKNALKIADKVLIIIGSHKASPNIKNPFTFEERKEMISRLLETVEVLPDGTQIVTGDLSRVKFIPVRDYYYNDNLWVTDVQQKTSEYIKPNDTVALVGAYKDASSYYLNLFPQWEFVPIEQRRFLSSTNIRNAMYDRDNNVGDWNEFHPEKAIRSIKSWEWISDIPSRIEGWLSEKYYNSQKYHEHVQEYNFIKDYKKKWENSPFPPVFNTVDAIVVCSGHVLVVKRKFAPGRGLFALPGGFIKQTERLEDAALRELKEETGIGVTKLELKNSIEEIRTFDYPNRSLRGRTITQAFYIKLKDKELPKVSADSDAETVHWMQFSDMFNNEDKFYEDHFQIIQNFILR